MGFIPADARWYLADVVLEHRVEGGTENLVYVNTHLIEASSPDAAYDKAVALGLQEGVGSGGTGVPPVFPHDRRDAGPTEFQPDRTNRTVYETADEVLAFVERCNYPAAGFGPRAPDPAAPDPAA